MWFMAILVMVAVSSCGRETVNMKDTTPPFVLSTVPTQGATGASLNPVISATFSESMTASTISASTFTVVGPNGPVTGAVTLSGNTATFAPPAALVQDSVYTATITNGVKDLAGNTMVQNYVWNFEILEVPSIVSTNPVNGATAVPTSQTITAAFLQDSDSPPAALDCATVTATTFMLTSTAGPVAGTVTCSGSTASFAPTAPLVDNTAYTATITTGVLNVAGNGMASPFVWTFTTGSQPRVISTIPANGATGVPLDQTLSAVFSETMNCATLNAPANNFTLTGPGGIAVAGTVNCTGNNATFSPSALLTANTLYTAMISAAATNTLGEHLVAGYVWSFRTVPAPSVPTVISTNPANNAVGVPVSQQIAATFSEAMNPTTINATTFTLTGPGGVAITGVVTYAVSGSVATFTPTSDLAPSTAYVAKITTGAQDLATPPDALAADYSWTFTTGGVPDTTKPTVISTIPITGATNVSINQAISATFSKPIDPLTTTATTFTVTGPDAAAVTGTVTYAAIGNTATFTPIGALAANTLFTATITTGVADLSGNMLAVNYVWTFTTGAAPDVTPPTIVLTAPASGATGVPLNQSVNATFSEPMDPMTITSATFLLTGEGGDAVTGTITYDALNLIATFTPSVTLDDGTLYTATVTNGATDLAGNPLAAGLIPNPWSFTTGGAILTPPPPLVAAAPYGGFGGNAGMTNQGILTVINGAIGTTAVSTLITGFHDNTPGCVYTETPLNIGLVNGAINTAPPPPTVGCPNEGTAVTAANGLAASSDAYTEYFYLAGIPGGLDVSVCPGCGGGAAGELGTRTLAPGIYKSAPGSFAITLGDLTLDAKGDPNAFWVFQMATTLTVGTPATQRTVFLANGAQAKNVYWQVGTAATINGIVGGGTMQGTIIAQSGVSVSTAGVVAITTIDGRAIALSGPITVVNTVINVPAP
jgi:hypothetical protein